MMKRMNPIQVKALLRLLPVVAAMCVLAACEQNDGVTTLLPQPEDGGGNTGNSSALCIIATKQPFADESGTRASTDLGGTYATTFENDDRIGIIAVKDGAVLDECNNLPLVYDGIEKKWEGSDIFYKNGATYIAYSPYSSLMDGKKSVQEIYDAFSVPANQMSAASFAKADLMTSTTCTADKTAKTLTISFEHRMAMMEIDRLHGYTDDDWTYPIKNSSVSATIGGTSYLLYKNASEDESAPFRCLLKPGTKSLTVDYSISSDDGGNVIGGTWTPPTGRTFNCAAGERLRIVPCKARNISVGDYYYSDGSIFPNEAGITPPGMDRGCAGIVYCTDIDRIGQGEKDALKAKGVNTAHGLVMAVTNTNAIGSWGKTMTDEGLSNANLVYLMYGDINGYTNTEYILTRYSTIIGYWGFKYASQYGVVLPANTTGWFMPSMGQWWDILKNLGGVTELIGYQKNNTKYILLNGAAPKAITNLNNYMSNVSGAEQFILASEFWTSSEADQDLAGRVSFYENSNLRLGDAYKAYDLFIRPSFAF